MAGAAGLFFILPARAQPVVDGFALTVNDPSAPMVDGPTRLPTFFPAAPPILGAPPPSPTFVDLRIPPPAELAIYVNEPFYTPLGTLLAEQKVSSKLATRLAAFVAQRTALESALMARLAMLASSVGTEREREWASLRSAQEPELADWNKTAEKLRADCVDDSADWSRLRHLVPADPEPKNDQEQKEREHDAFLAIAGYQEGLSAGQRDLLHELAAEREPETFSPERRMVMAAGRRTLYFLPGAARIVVPASLPTPLAEKLAAFEELKAGLKRELSETLALSRKATSLGRGRIWRKLAAAQAGRLATLETQAEDLRDEFQRNAISFSPTPTPELPPSFAARLDRFRHGADELQAEFGRRLSEQLRVLLAYHPGSGAVPYRVSSSVLGPTGGALPGTSSVYYLHALQFLPPPDATENERRILSQLRAVADAFRKDHAAQSQALDEERRRFTEEFASLLPKDSSLPSDQAFGFLVRVLAQADEWRNFSEYREAVLLPGLSPNQRRLLFGVALRRLARPLPGGKLEHSD